MASKRVGDITRGTTAPNRLRRVDRWLLHTHCSYLRSVDQPLCVDLGFGHEPTTTLEWSHRLREHVRPDVAVVGVEIDPARVTAALPLARTGLEFVLGGFEIPLAGRQPHVIRAFNVLRQYSESDVQGAWALMGSRLAPGGVLIDGTCDEVGRLSTWIALTQGNDGVAARTLTMSTQCSTLEQPSRFATRLPKSLIHRNVPGQRIHDFLREFDAAWAAHAGLAVFSARQRFVASVQRLQEQGWPIHDNTQRWRLGEVTVDFEAVSP